MYIRNPGHMTKIAAMPIYGKNPSKISRTGGRISTKLGMKHRWLKHYNVYINHFFIFKSVLRPFQDYFSSYETGQSVGGAKTGEP